MGIAILFATGIRLRTKQNMKSAEFLILVCLILGVESERIDYSGYKVYRIIPESEDDLEFLKSIQESEIEEGVLDFWTEPRSVGHPVDIMVPPYLQPFETKTFQRQSLKYRVMVHDVQLQIDQVSGKESGEKAREKKNSVLENTFDGFNYSTYHPYGEIVDWINDTAKSKPNLASFFQIGKSYEGRDINGLKLGSKKSSNRLKFWIEGGIHAREWITPATVIFLIKELINDYGVDPTVTRIMDEIDWFFIPSLNVDGYAYTWSDDRLWRKTRSINPSIVNRTDPICVGVDPNRNWDINWSGEGASFNPCSYTYHGPYPFSEVEVKSVADFILKEKNFDFFMDIHSYSQLYLTPWCYKYDYPVQKDYLAQMELAKTAIHALEAVYHTQYTYGPCATTIYISSGSSLDWGYANASILHSGSFELRDTGEYGFLLPDDQIMPTGEETYEGLKAIALYLLGPEDIAPTTAPTTAPTNSGPRVGFSPAFFLSLILYTFLSKKLVD